MNIHFDEWNVWYQKKQTRFPWEVAPPILEDIYSLVDALVFGGMLCILLNNADRVKMACLAQLVNVIPPIFTEKGGRIVKQAIFYPFQQVSNFGRGEALKPIVKCSTFESNLYGEAPIVQSAVTYDKENETVTVFALNCDQQEDIQFTIDFRSFENSIPIKHVVLDGPDLYAQNTFGEPDKVKTGNVKIESNQGGIIDVIIPKLSWNMIRFSTSNK